MEISFFWTRQLHVDTCTKKLCAARAKFHRSRCLRRSALHDVIESFALSPGKISILILILNFTLLVDVAVIIIFFEFITKNNNLLAERGFDPRTSGLWAQHATTAPLCWRYFFESCVMVFNFEGTHHNASSEIDIIIGKKALGISLSDMFK